MSATSSSPTIKTWTLCLLGVIVLYIATWPPIEMKCTTVSVSHMSTLDGPYRSVSLSTPPALTVLYYPLNQLRLARDRKNPFEWYWYWWANRLAPSGNTFPF